MVGTIDSVGAVACGKKKFVVCFNYDRPSELRRRVYLFNSYHDT
jgi:hypothetical protein